jgi:hypothetical protein
MATGVDTGVTVRLKKLRHEFPNPKTHDDLIGVKRSTADACILKFAELNDRKRRTFPQKNPAKPRDCAAVKEGTNGIKFPCT